MFNRSAKKEKEKEKEKEGLVATHSTLAYPHRLNFYDEPPIHNITLEQFEAWAIDRLRVLTEIEAARIRNVPEGIKNIVNSQCEKYLMLHPSSDAASVDLDAERRKDHVSHFVLRLAFCRSEELRQKFVKAETDLFKIRFLGEGTKDRAAFLASKTFGPSGQPISDDDKRLLKNQLMAATNSLKTDADFEKETFYRVHWTKVADLVATRRVFIKAGYAYVPSASQSSIVLQEFQSRLTTALEMTARALPSLDEDDRLLPIITHFSQGFLAGIAGEDHDGRDNSYGETVTKDMIDDMTKKHFPLCMRNIHNALRHDKALKHQGRLQYTLFLKVLGLPIEEAILFWGQSYGHSDKFNKEYKYNIRHSYGLEGKRANYPARDCRSIVTDNPPGPNDSHGCPFRYFSTSNLRSALSALYGISSVSQDMSDILNAVEAKQYHVACTRVFELTHNGEGMGEGESVRHPNRYAARSRELEREKQAREQERAKALAGTGSEGAPVEDTPMLVDA